MTGKVFQLEKVHSNTASQTAINVALQKSFANLKEHEENGWWSYVGNNSPSIEATAWCALALHGGLQSTESSVRTVNFLLTKQNHDGGWSTAPLCGPSDWSSAPALLALRLLNEKKALAPSSLLEQSVLNGSNFLFHLRTDIYKSVIKLMLFLMNGKDGLHYGRGWPWNKDCFFWVEPTSYSLLALKLPQIPDQDLIKSAINHASIFLHDHACRNGGWNHGANFCLGIYAPPYTVTTAEALLALQDEPLSPVIEKAIALISAEHQDCNSSMPLAWSILALHAYGKDLGNKATKLIAHQNADGSFGTNNMVTGIATLALLAAGQNCNLLKTQVRS